MGKSTGNPGNLENHGETAIKMELYLGQVLLPDANPSLERN